MRFFVFMVPLLVTLVTQNVGASNIVESANRRELNELRTAVGKAFNLQCPEVKKLPSGSFSIDLQPCLPLRVSEILGNRAAIGGPNCYNFSLYALGILDSLRGVNEAELTDLYFSDTSATCSRIDSSSSSPRAGDVMSLEYTSGWKLHAFVWLTEKYALTKNGPETSAPWQISSPENILETYPIPNDERLLVRYRCKKPQEKQLTGEVRNAVKAITAFSKFVTKAQKAHGLALIPQSEFRNQIASLSQSLPLDRMVQLVSATQNALVRQKLYELVSQLYSVKVYYYGLKELSNKDAMAFKPFAELYLEILDRFLSVSSNTFGLEGVTNSEDLLEYEFCSRKDWTPKICNVGNGH